MSENSVPYQIAQPNKPRRGYLTAIIVIAIIIVGFLGLVYSANSPLASHTMTTTQQQLITNVQNLYSTQTVTLANVNAVNGTAAVTSIAAIPSYGNGPSMPGYGNGPAYPPFPEYQTCQYNCSYPGPAYNMLCQSSSVNDTVQCSGYIYHDTSGCVELAIPYVNPDYLESVAYQYYTLRNLPSFVSSGWVTVTGQLNQGFTVSPSGGVCPLNYIQVSSIS